MSCYHPIVGLWKGQYTDSGKKKYELCWNTDIYDVPSVYQPVLIPCGKCIGCRLDYSRSWADRMILELETSKKAIFVTLTYNNDHIPIAMLDDDYYPSAFTLDKRDCQLFMKRLRRAYSGTKVRFYLSGEYGPSTLRPHYHAIIFGLGLSDFSDLSLKGKNEIGQDYYLSPTLARIWNNGFVLISDVSWATCAYVSRYVSKKVQGLNGFDFSCLNAQPEFSLMSRRPGIASEYLDLHPECLDYRSLSIGSSDGSKKIYLPKYYLSRLQVDNPERYDIIMSERKELAEDRMLLKLQKTGLSFLDYLELEEQNKIESVKSLKRDRVDRKGR